MADKVKEAAELGIKAFTRLTTTKTHPDTALTPVQGAGAPHPDGYLSHRVLEKAKGLVFLKTVKAGAVVGLSFGSGFVITKLGQDGKAPTWSAPSFLSAHEGSFGITLGAATVTSIMVLSSDAAVEKFKTLDSHIKLGSDINLILWQDWAAGEGVEFKDLFVDNVDAIAFTYGEGLIGDWSIKGGSLATDTGSNEAVYGKDAIPKKILGGEVEHPSALEHFYTVVADFYKNPPAPPTEEPKMHAEHPNAGGGF